MNARTLLTLLAAGVAMPAGATIPYTPVTLPPGAFPVTGPGLIAPADTFGKEYSHDFDQTTAGLGGAPDAQQVIAWDGIGGTADGLDYSGTRPTYSPDDQVDAIANHNDGLFRALRDDEAHLVFSHDDNISVYGGPVGGLIPGMAPAAGPVFLSGGHTIGGAGELSYELAGPPSTMGVWATQPMINGMPLPRDVDGVELWGPEPGTSGDADKYSLQIDDFSGIPGGPPGTGTSVWNLSGTPYIPHSAIVGAVTTLLGAVPGTAVLPYPDEFLEEAAINVDALMVRDIVGDPDTFDRSDDGAPGDQIIFSISQIPDPADPDGYYATGSELFVLDATSGPGGASYLFHGGHLWDHGFGFTDLVISPNQLEGAYGVIDINAIEAVGELVGVPEPTAAVMLVAGLAATTILRRRVG